MDVEAVMLTLEGDEGQLGTSLAWTAELPVRTVVTAIEEAAAPLLAGADPLDRPRILAPLWRAFRVGLPLPVIGIVDVALWDLVARDEDLSIADLLGRRRDRIRGCASAPPVDTPEDCEAMVDELLDAGFRAIKLHVCGDLATDTAVCRAARRAAGDDVDLMMDAMALYDRYSARTLGFVLDDLNFRWFEDPLSDEDLEGWRELRRLIETPIAGADSVRFTARDYGRPAATGPSTSCAWMRRETASRSCARSPTSPHRWGSGARDTASAPPSGRPRTSRSRSPSPTATSSSCRSRWGGSTSACKRVSSSTRTATSPPPTAPGSGSSSIRTPSPRTVSTSAEARHGAGAENRTKAGGVGQGRSRKVSAAATSSAAAAVRVGTWKLSPIRYA